MTEESIEIRGNKIRKSIEICGNGDLTFRDLTSRQTEPICPYCKEVMVKGRIEMERGGWLDVWLCGCVGEDESTVEASDEDSNLGG